jgi:hypothetical protein
MCIRENAQESEIPGTQSHLNFKPLIMMCFTFFLGQMRVTQLKASPVAVSFDFVSRFLSSVARAVVPHTSFLKA